MKRRLYGLYAITPDSVHGPELVERTAAALRGGARLVQYRDKRTDAESRLDAARQLRALCTAAGALLIINDDCELAAAAAADGVHLGRDDTPPGHARAVLGDNAVIGISCYDSIERAATAIAAGADYIAFGSFFPSPTKPDAVPAAPDLITRAKTAFEVPVCAIGGITPQNGGQLVAAGADMLAILSGLFSGTDVEASARMYTKLFA